MLGEEPPPHPLERKVVNVNGRREHESYLKDPKKCKESGLDIVYETIVYLRTWGGWLEDESKKDLG